MNLQFTDDGYYKVFYGLSLFKLIQCPLVDQTKQQCFSAFISCLCLVRIQYLDMFRTVTVMHYNPFLQSISLHRLPAVAMQRV